MGKNRSGWEGTENVWIGIGKDGKEEDGKDRLLDRKYFVRDEKEVVWEEAGMGRVGLYSTAELMFKNLN